MKKPAPKKPAPKKPAPKKPRAPKKPAPVFAKPLAPDPLYRKLPLLEAWRGPKKKLVILARLIDRKQHISWFPEQWVVVGSDGGGWSIGPATLADVPKATFIKQDVAACESDLELDYIIGTWKQGLPRKMGWEMAVWSPTEAKLYLASPPPC